MNEQIETKKSFLKKYCPTSPRLRWVKWVGLTLIIVGVVGFFIYSSQNDKKIEEEKQKQKQISDEQTNNQQNYQYITPKMTSEQLSEANSLLEGGIVIEDPQNDFAIPKGEGADALGRPDNTEPYSLGWNDLKKVTFNSNDKTFYIRYDFYGVIPEKMVTIGNDEIHGIGGGVVLNNFITNGGQTNEGMWQFGVNWIRGTNDDKTALAWTTEYEEIPGQIDVSGIASPGEVDKFGETQYTTGMFGSYSGGVGYDYLIAAYPLDGFDIKPGSEITFTIAVETNSKVYHHSSIDPLLDFGSEKSGKIINYKLGTTTYTTAVPEYK